jgi:hypothetical protein
MTPETEQSSRKKSSSSPAPQFWWPHLLLESVTFNLKISNLSEMYMGLMQEVVDERLSDHDPTFSTLEFLYQEPLCNQDFSP